MAARIDRIEGLPLPLNDARLPDGLCRLGGVGDDGLKPRPRQPDEFGPDGVPVVFASPLALATEWVVMHSIID